MPKIHDLNLEKQNTAGEGAPVFANGRALACCLSALASRDVHSDDSTPAV